jgi:hypothetical protein
MVADLILGINAYHADAAACIVRSPQLAKVDLGAVTHVAVNRSSRANFFRELRYVAFARRLDLPRRQADPNRVEKSRRNGLRME